MKNIETANQPLPPFSCVHSPNVPALLHQLKCTIALSTYQAGKLVLLSSVDGQRLVQLPRTFQKPMGIALDGDRMGIATLDEVIVLSNSKELATHYPQKPRLYDALFMPRATYYTGHIDIHDLEWGSEGRLFGVNTSFSCICSIDDHFSFRPYWQPRFISKLAHEDRCHLNGMAMENGLPKYATAFNQGDSRQSWRDRVTETGILMDVESGTVIRESLAMPHSPRIYDGQLFLLLSASGELVQVDVDAGKYVVVAALNGFVRGLARCGDYLFVGLSKLRASSSSFAKLPMSHRAQRAGITIVQLSSGKIIGEIRYETSVEEIYDVQILPNVTRPNILNTLQEQHKQGLSIPGTTYWSAQKTTP